MSQQPLKSSKAKKDLSLWGATLPGIMVSTDDLSFLQKSMTMYKVGCELLEEPGLLVVPLSELGGVTEARCSLYPRGKLH